MTAVFMPTTLTTSSEQLGRGDESKGPPPGLLQNSLKPREPTIQNLCCLLPEYMFWVQDRLIFIYPSTYLFWRNDGKPEEVGLRKCIIISYQVQQPGKFNPYLGLDDLQVNCLETSSIYF